MYCGMFLITTAVGSTSPPAGNLHTNVKVVGVVLAFRSADENKLWVVCVCVYSQLSRKRPPLVHDKVVAYGRWSLTRKINKISLILD